MTKKKRFRWTKKRSESAIMRAQGYYFREIVEALSVGMRTVKRWAAHPEFDAEVDRLTLMTGIAARAERLRIAKRVVRQKVTEERVQTSLDLLTWLKFAQSETDGIKLDLTSVLEDALALAGGGPEGDAAANDSAGDGTDADA